MWRQNTDNPQIQINKFLYHQKPPALYEENCHPRQLEMIGVSKKSKCPPLVREPSLANLEFFAANFIRSPVVWRNADVVLCDRLRTCHRGIALTGSWTAM